MNVKYNTWSLEARVADAARDSVPDAARLATHVRSISTWDSMQPTPLAKLRRAHVKCRVARVRGVSRLLLVLQCP
jgi:hypothetical protein